MLLKDNFSKLSFDFLLLAVDMIYIFCYKLVFLLKATNYKKMIL